MLHKLLHKVPAIISLKLGPHFSALTFKASSSSVKCYRQVQTAVDKQQCYQ